MIPFVDDCYFISRKDNIIFANLTNGDQVPLVRLKQNFIDVNILEGQSGSRLCEGKGLEALNFKLSTND